MTFVQIMAMLSGIIIGLIFCMLIGPWFIHILQWYERWVGRVVYKWEHKR